MNPNFKRKNIFRSSRSVDGFTRTTSQVGNKMQKGFRPDITSPNTIAKVAGNGEINQPRVLLDNFAKQDGFHGSSSNLQSIKAQHQNAFPPIDSSVFNITPDKNKRKHLLKRPRIKTVFKSLALCGVIGLVLVGGIVAKGWWRANQILKGGAEGAISLTRNADPSLLKTEGDGRVNILLVGKGGEDHEAGDLTDTMLIASVDPTGKTAALLSVPRDLYIKYPGQGSMKINAVYSTAKQLSLSNKKSSTSNKEALAEADIAGIKKLESILSATMGIPINYYAMVDFTAFKEAVDTVGGIDITLDEAIYDPNFDWQYGRNSVKYDKGLVHLDGLHATLLGRARGAAGGYGVGSDFDRNENQRKMLVALKSKILSVGTLANPLKVNQLIDSLGSHVSTNLSVGEIMKLYEIGKDISTSSIASIGLTDEKSNFVTTDYVDGQSIVLPRAGLYDFSEIQNFVRNALKDGYLLSENARIVVLNGSGITGLAAQKSTELKSFGYSVMRVGDSPLPLDKTKVIDLTGGVMKYTKRYLELRTGTSAETSLPEGFSPESADFVILLGANEANSP